MKIVQLSAENVKRIKAVEIRPDGSIVELAGRNKQGKSSILDAIWLALKNSAASKETKLPIREGEDHARIRLDLGEIVVTRTWTDDGKTELLVTDADGTPKGRPQELLDKLVGKLSFDPVTFINETNSQQVTTLVGVVDLPFDPEVLAQDRQDLYDRRHLVGQEVKRAKGAYESFPPMASNGLPYEDLPAEPEKTADLLAEYQEVQDEITRHNDARRDLDTANKAVEDAELAMAQAQQALNAAVGRQGACHRAVEKLGECPSVGPVKEALEAAESTNQAIRDAKAYYDARALFQAKQNEWDLLDQEIKNLDKQKSDALAAVQFPIDGLGFDEDGVTFNDKPFSQASGAEKLQVSLAIAMALNPQLRVIRITDGSLLDKDSMALIEKMATDNDFQVWIERVDESGTTGLVIEDGKVV